MGGHLMDNISSSLVFELRKGERFLQFNPFNREDDYVNNMRNKLAEKIKDSKIQKV